MDVGERAAAGPLLLDAGVAGRFAQHPALCNEHNMTVREFLFKFSGQPGGKTNTIE